ncbi:MAG: TIGR03087 family PEP-CTERM/XrtA system glycosyltransferase [Candidatus Binatia bacterium]
MKILFLAHRIPYPPNKGDKIRSYHLLRSLAQKHEISLVCWLDDAGDKQYEPTLGNLCRGALETMTVSPSGACLNGLGFLLSGRSFSEGYFYSRRLQGIVDRLVQRNHYGLVYAFSSPMAQYVRAHREIPLLMDFVDADSQKWLQLARFKKFPLSAFFLWEGTRLANYEVAVSSRASWSVFVSAAEAALFKSIGGKGNILAIPNGVDSDLFRLPVQEPEGEAGAGASHPGGRVFRLIFAGTMNYFPNEDAVLYFVREVFPLIRRECPNVVFDVAGRSPSRSLRRLDGIEGVRILGEVGDIKGHLVRADVSVAPLRIARGIQNKVLEAMAMGIPVVATPDAVAGIDVEPGEDLLVAASPEAFARHVISLLRDPQLRCRMAKRARSKMVQQYSWKRMGAQLEKIIEEGLGDARMSRVQRGI